MKTEIKNQKPVFAPVTVEITCESQEELDFFASLFNHSAVCDAANANCPSLRGLNESLNIFWQAGGCRDKTKELGIKY